MLCIFCHSDPPEVTVLTKNATVNDTSVDIKCEAVGVPSKYAFRPWRQTWPGTDFIIRDEIYPSENILTIWHPSYQDTGVYTCFAENGVSVWDTDMQLMSGSVYLLVECKCCFNDFRSCVINLLVSFIFMLLFKSISVILS